MRASKQVSVSQSLPWVVVLPLRFEVESGGLERVCLLLDRVPHHLPEALGHGEAQVAGRYLRRVDNASPDARTL